MTDHDVQLLVIGICIGDRKIACAAQAQLEAARERART
jgi:membrane protein required for beta-lactamase induction